MADDPNYAFAFFATLLAGLSLQLGLIFIPLINSGLFTEEKGLAASMSFAAGVMLWLAFVGVMGREATELFTGHFEEDAECPFFAGGGHKRAGETCLFTRIWIFTFFIVGLFFTALLEMAVDRYFGDVGHGHGHGHGHGNHGEAREVAVDAEVAADAGHGEGHADHGHSAAQGMEIEAAGSSKDATGSAGVGGSAMLLAKRATGSIFMAEPEDRDSSLLKVSMVAMLALFLHNFPEGLIVFFSAANGDLTILLGIVLHHIPAGVAIAVPAHKATGSYWKAAGAALFAGMAQPLGAAVGWALIGATGIKGFSNFVNGALYSATAGTLTAIALSGMLPEALHSASNFFVLCFLAAGFIFMEATIIINDATGGHSHG